MVFQRGGFGQIPPVVKNILIINVLMFFGTLILGYTTNINLTRILGLFYIQSDYFEPYQYLSYMFMHDPNGFAHIFFNMFAFWMFGRILENFWGGKRFFVYFIATGIGAALIHTMVNWFMLWNMHDNVQSFIDSPAPRAFAELVSRYLNEPADFVLALKQKWLSDPDNIMLQSEAIEVAKRIAIVSTDNMMQIPMIGASGAVFGVLLAFGMQFPNAKIMLLIPPIPIKAKYFVMIYGVIELFAGVANIQGDNVAHFAHLGGMIFGFILLKYWGITSRSNFM